MSKRANNEGSIYQRTSDGRWVASIIVDYSNGRAKRRVFYGTTQAEALDKLKAARTKLQSGHPIPPERYTVGKLLDEWLAQVVKAKNRPSTYRRHADIVRVHIKPSLGHVRLAKLRPGQVQALLNDKLASGLSPRSVAYIRVVLRAALHHGMRWGLVGINAAALTDPPPASKHQVTPMTVDDARRLLEAIRGHENEHLFVVALASGLRQGELLGARWQDFDQESGTLKVTYSLQKIDGQYRLVKPKTDQSRRTVALPDIAVTALRAQRDRQTFERAAAGAEWNNEHDLIFATPLGAPFHGPTITRRFQACLASVGIPRQRFHDLRHGTATLMLAQGVPLKVVQEVLGHTTITTTADVYAHLLPELKREAATSMDNALRGAQ